VSDESNRWQPDRLASILNELSSRLEGRRLAWRRRPRIHLANIIDPDPNVIEDGDAARERTRKLTELTQRFAWNADRLELFRRLVAGYWKDRNIQNYLEIRRNFPEIDIQVSLFGGLDPILSIQQDLEKQGIDFDLVVYALDGDEVDIDALSLHLLECLVARSKLPTTGPGHIQKRRSAISDTTVNFLIVVMLEAMDWHEEVSRVPGSLTVLIREQITGMQPDLFGSWMTSKKRNDAAHIVAQLCRPGRQMPVRKLAQLAGVSRSTAARWLSDRQFQESVDAYREAARKLADPQRTKSPE
jgi:hypothetical protein